MNKSRVAAFAVVGGVVWAVATLVVAQSATVNVPVATGTNTLSFTCPSGNTKQASWTATTGSLVVICNDPAMAAAAEKAATAALCTAGSGVQSTGWDTPHRCNTTKCTFTQTSAQPLTGTCVPK